MVTVFFCVKILVNNYIKPRSTAGFSNRIRTRSESFFRCQCSGLQVPLAVVEEILLKLPAHQVVRVCRLVCHEWKELVDSAAYWRERCRREKIQPREASRLPDDWRLFYFLTKKRRNLLKNPIAEGDSYQYHWYTIVVFINIFNYFIFIYFSRSCSRFILFLSLLVF